jgi:hypothetical protein
LDDDRSRAAPSHPAGRLGNRPGPITIGFVSLPCILQTPISFRKTSEVLPAHIGDTPHTPASGTSRRRRVPESRTPPGAASCLDSPPTGSPSWPTPSSSSSRSLSSSTSGPPSPTATGLSSPPSPPISASPTSASATSPPTR